MSKQNLLRYLPSVDRILTRLQAKEFNLPERYLVDIARTVVSETRENILHGDMAKDLDSETVENRVFKMAELRCIKRLQKTMRPVINATGIVLHTGLGRAPLSKLSREAIALIANGFSNLEFDLESGERGQRNDHIEDLLCALTGAESSLTVNNNAAAVFLALNTMAEEGEAIISRGQLVEIGGSFRIPEVMKKSGARMVEVGTTNRTHLRDYEQAINDDTRLIVVAHPSNYRIEGFTQMPSIEEIAELAHSHGIPVLYDLGSGALFSLEQYDLLHEPEVSQALEAGVDVVTFSGDKLIGGPQGGLLCGKKQFLDRLKTNPLARVLRCDKLTVAAMEATLRTYERKETLPEQNLTYHLLTRTIASLEAFAYSILDELSDKTINRLGLQLRGAKTEAGSGSLPTETIPSAALVITNTDVWSADKIMRWLRTRESIPVVGYILDDWCYLNLRAVLEDQRDELVKALTELARKMRN